MPNDLFYIIVIPILTAIVVGFGINFYARMREGTRFRRLNEKIAIQAESMELLRKELERLRELTDSRGRMLLRLQEERLKPLVKTAEKIGLGQTIEMEDRPPALPAQERAFFELVLEETEQIRSLDVPILPELASTMAMLLYAEGQWDKAVKYLELALEGDSTDQETRISLANLYLKKRMFEEAGGHFQALIDFAGHRFEGHLGLGLAQVRLGRAEEGIKSLTTAIRLRPENARVYSELGRAYVEIGELGRALESAQVALKLAPEMEEGHLLQQQILIKSGKFQEAISACRRQLASGDSPRVLFNLAVAYSRSGDMEGALNALQRATGLDDQLRFAAKDDPAFAPLRGTRRFKDILEGRPGLF